jgi:hypothetical protein
MKLVSIRDADDKEHFVNPEFVTAIKAVSRYRNGNQNDRYTMREVWVVGNAGYGTFQIETLEKAEELAIRLEKVGK